MQNVYLLVMSQNASIFFLSGSSRKSSATCMIYSTISYGPGCSKLTTSLVNVSLKFQTLISEICQYFLLKSCAKASLIFLTKISVYLVIKS